MGTKDRAHFKAFAKLNQSIIKWKSAETDDWAWVDKDNSKTIREKQINYTREEAEVWKYILKLIEADNK